MEDGKGKNLIEKFCKSLKEREREREKDYYKQFKTNINPGFYVSVATMAYPTVFENTGEYNASTSASTHNDVTLRNAFGQDFPLG